MVQRSASLRPLVRWPISIFLNVVLAFSAAAAWAQDSLDIPSFAGRLSHNPLYGPNHGGISGTVSLQGDSGPAAGVIVTVRSLKSSEMHSVTTDAAGHFEVDGLAFGPYTVSAEARGYESASTNTQVEPGSAEVALSLKPVNSLPSREALGDTVSVHQLKVPSKAQSFYEKGLEHLDKDPTGSAQYFAKAIEKYPGYYEAYYQLGQAQARLNQNDQAMKSFQTAIDLSGGKFARAAFAYGLLLCQQGKAQDAERIVRRGLEQNDNLAFGYLALGVVLLRLQRPVEAEKSAQEVLLRDPRSPDAYLILADSHGARNQYSAEVKDLDAFLTMVPNGSRTEFARGLRSAAQRLANETEHTPRVSQIPQRPNVLDIQPSRP
jgi:Tfp pilus assembly protein PilF